MQKTANGNGTRRTTAARGNGAPNNQKRSAQPADFWIILLTMILVVIGLIMVYDSSYYAAQQSAEYNHDGMYFLKKQLVGLVMGIVAMAALSYRGRVFGVYMDYHFWQRITFPLLGIALVLMIMVWIPGVGVTVNNASRWVQIGPLPSIQPSEPAKFAVIVYLAHLFTLRKNEMGDFMRTVVPALFITGIFCLLLLLQPNMSMLMTYIFVLGLMLWIGGAKWQHLLLLVGLGAVALYIGFQIWPHVAKRMTIFLDPESDPLGDGYQILQSLYAIANGGFGGVGIGNSIQKYLYLPYRETDFIFAIYAEEFGFIGCIVLFALYWLLIWRCVIVTVNAPDRFGKMLAAGITIMLAVQVLINIGVVVGCMPPTGLPLPFISSGGTSLAIFLAEIGVMLNISKAARSHRSA